ncbi:hypothetical protein PHSC3_001786 [Chlamydiales bacterium STE3]|nr:hypothetical protein PHSC3_001786 [Chlamydiales bacterium STE3]
MKKCLFYGAVALLLNANTSLFSESQLDLDIPVLHKKAIQGPPGPTGPPGPPGNLALRCCSNWSNTPYEVPFNNLIGEVPFENAQLAPMGIIHPVGGNSSYCLIVSSGIYQILWNITAHYQATTPNTTALLMFRLFNVTQDVFYPPEVHCSCTLTDKEVKTISGHTTLFIPAGTIIQLQANTTATNTTLTNRTITVMQIAQEVK